MPPPIIQIGPANQTLPLHSDVTLHCKATNPEGENPVIRWLRDGEQLTQENLPKRYTLNPDGTLLIDGKLLVLIVYFVNLYGPIAVHWSVHLIFSKYSSTPT